MFVNLTEFFFPVFPLSPPAEQALHPQPSLLQHPFDWQGGHPWPGEDLHWHQVWHQLVRRLAAPALIFVLLTSLLFCSNKKWHTQLRYELFVPVVLFRCSPVYSSAHRVRENSLLAVYFCTCTQWVCMWVMHACSCLYMCYKTQMCILCCIKKEKKFKNCRSSVIHQLCRHFKWDFKRGDLCLKSLLVGINAILLYITKLYVAQTLGYLSH